MPQIQFVMDAEGSRAINTFVKLAQTGDQAAKSTERHAKKTEEVGKAAEFVETRARAMGQAVLGGLAAFASVGTVLRELNELDRVMASLVRQQEEVAGGAAAINLGIINPGREREAVQRAIQSGQRFGVSPGDSIAAVLTMQSQLGTLEAGLEAAPAVFQAKKLLGTEGTIDDVVGAVKGGQAKGLTASESVLATGVAAAASSYGFAEIASSAPAAAVFQTFQAQQMAASVLSEVLDPEKLKTASENVARTINLPGDFAEGISKRAGIDIAEFLSKTEVEKLRLAAEVVPELAGTDKAAQLTALKGLGVQDERMTPMVAIFERLDRFAQLMDTFERRRSTGEDMGAAIEAVTGAVPAMRAADIQRQASAVAGASVVEGPGSAEFTRLSALASAERAAAVAAGREHELDPDTGELRFLPAVRQVLRSVFTGEDLPVRFERMMARSPEMESRARERLRQEPGGLYVPELTPEGARRESEDRAASALEKAAAAIQAAAERFDASTAPGGKAAGSNGSGADVASAVRQLTRMLSAAGLFAGDESGDFGGLGATD